MGRGSVPALTPKAADRLIPLSDAEMRVYHLSEAINDRGVRIDIPSVHGAIALVEKKWNSFIAERRSSPSR